MGGSVTLVCRTCGRRAPYFRRNDPDLPAECETISQGKCDLCDDGDFSEEWMLDADGKQINPARYGPSDGSQDEPRRAAQDAEKPQHSDGEEA